MPRAKRTNEKSTWGIVNIPKVGFLKNARYPFFELDRQVNRSNIDYMQGVNTVLESYKKRGWPVLMHTTERGHHFICLFPIDKEEYSEWMREIKHLNPHCPMVTLRILPNKWEGETFTCQVFDWLGERPLWLDHLQNVIDSIEWLNAHTKCVGYHPKGDEIDL